MRQILRVFLHHLDGLLAVGLEDLAGTGGRDPVALEKEYDLPDLFLLLPGLFDHLDVLIPDALDQPGSQISLGPGRSGRYQTFTIDRLELLPELGVVDPFPFHLLQDLAGQGRGHVPDDRDQVPAAMDLDLGHGIAVLFVGVGDSFDLALQMFEGCFLR